MKIVNIVDVAMPLTATYVWMAFQSYSVQAKSFGNLAELSILGVIWGVVFLMRGIAAIKGKHYPIILYAVFEWAMTVMLAILAPTFSE